MSGEIEIVQVDCRTCDGTGKVIDHDKKCWNCNGDGYTDRDDPKRCERCKGEGYDKKDCGSCGGRGTVVEKRRVRKPEPTIKPRHSEVEYAGEREVEEPTCNCRNGQTCSVCRDTWGETDPNASGVGGM